MLARRVMGPLKEKCDEGHSTPSATKTDPLEEIEAARMEEVLTKLVRTAPGRAVEFYKAILAACYEKAEEVGDSSGNLGMFVDRLFSGWVKAR